MTSQSFLPSSATAHQRLAYAAELARFPDASPLWQSAAAWVVMGMLAPELFRTGMEQEVRRRLDAQYPGVHFAMSGFFDCYPILTWTDGPTKSSMMELIRDVAELWSKKRYVAPDGSVHARPARSRHPIIINHRIQLLRKYSERTREIARRIHMTDAGRHLRLHDLLEEPLFDMPEYMEMPELNDPYETPSRAKRSQGEVIAEPPDHHATPVAAAPAESLNMALDPETRAALEVDQCDLAAIISAATARAGGNRDDFEKILAEELVKASYSRRPAAGAELSESDLSARMKAVGMFSIDEMMGPLNRFQIHSGMSDLAFFEQWLELKAREYLAMRAPYELGDQSKDDDLHEWVLAHSAVFHEVLVNFRAAKQAGKPTSL